MKKILLLVAIIVVSIAPSLVLAALPKYDIPVEGDSVGLSDIGLLIADVADFIITAAGLIIVGYIVYAGLKMVMAREDPKKFADGKQMLIHAAIGAVVVFGVGVIVNTIASFADNPTQITR